jgi:ribonucleoside-diphosphate reductase alpha chain
MAAPVATAYQPSANPMNAALENLMGDAPFCDVCGHITVRNGACYKCLNCGNSLGCS